MSATQPEMFVVTLRHDGYKIQPDTRDPNVHLLCDWAMQARGTLGFPPHAGVTLVHESGTLVVFRADRGIGLETLRVTLFGEAEEWIEVTLQDDKPIAFASSLPEHCADIDDVLTWVDNFRAEPTGEAIEILAGENGLEVRRLSGASRAGAMKADEQWEHTLDGSCPDCGNKH